MGIRMSNMTLEVRGNALDVVRTLTLLAARQRHSLSFDALKLPFGAFKTSLDRGTFLPCGKGPMIRPTVRRDGETRFRILDGPTLRANPLGIGAPLAGGALAPDLNVVQG
ncbi:hypothetical protein EV715DRAFT_276410 [Schizophyllum commune]